MATNLLISYRCRQCGSLFSRGIHAQLDPKASEALAEVMAIPRLLTAIHACHPGAPFVVGMGDIAGLRTQRVSEMVLPAEEKL